MIGPLDLSDGATVDRLLALQRAAYAVEARLIGSDAIPGLHETGIELAHSSEEFVGVHDGGELVAALVYEATPDVLDISRLVVLPTRACRGLGERLVRWVLEAVPRPKVVVSTGTDNEPAVVLYTKLGFAEIEREEVVRGLIVTRFELER